jgi:hypothetical protein
LLTSCNVSRQQTHRTSILGPASRWLLSGESFAIFLEITLNKQKTPSRAARRGDPEPLGFPLRGTKVNEKYHGFVADAPRNDGLCKDFLVGGRACSRRATLDRFDTCACDFQRVLWRESRRMPSRKLVSLTRSSEHPKPFRVARTMATPAMIRSSRPRSRGFNSSLSARDLDFKSS